MEENRGATVARRPSNRGPFITALRLFVCWDEEEAISRDFRGQFARKLPRQLSLTFHNFLKTSVTCNGVQLRRIYLNFILFIMIWIYSPDNTNILE